MKFKLEAGAEADILSADELHKELLPLMPRERATTWSDAETVRSAFLLVADAAGAVAEPDGSPLAVFSAPLGYQFRIARIAIDAAGYDVKTPLTAGSLTFYIGNILVYPLPSASTTLAPLVITEGDPAQVLFGGDVLAVLGAGLPASQQIRVSMQLRRRKQP